MKKGWIKAGNLRNTMVIATSDTNILPYVTICRKPSPSPTFCKFFFDGKQRTEATSGIKRECISVAVKGPTMKKEKFLGDESMEKGTGTQVGKVVKSLIDAWKLALKIIALNYDTCSVNTGKDLGIGCLSRNSR